MRKSAVVAFALVLAAGRAAADDPKPITNLAEILKLREQAVSAFQKSRELFDQKQYAAALAAAQKAVDIQERLSMGKPPSADLVTGLANLGVISYDLGELARAETHLRRAIELRPKCVFKPLGPELMAWHHLALVLRDMAAADPARLAEASALLEKAADQARLLRWAVPTSEYRLLAATVIENLGLLRSDQGDDVRSAELLQEVLAIRRGLGPDCPADDLLAAGNNLAIVLMRRRDWKTARLLQEQVAKGRRAIYEREPNAVTGDNLARALNNLGHTRFSLHLAGRENSIDQAERDVRESVRLSRRWLKADDPDLANRLQGLGEIRAVRFDYREAEAVDREALAILEKAFAGGAWGNDHADVAMARHNLALCLDGQGRSAEAVPLHRAAVTANRRLIERYAGVSTEESALAFAARRHAYLRAYLAATAAAGTPAAEVYSDVWAYKAAVTRAHEWRHATAVAAADPAARATHTALTAARRERERLILKPSKLLGPAERDRECRRLEGEIARLDRELAAALPAYRPPAADGGRGVAALQAALPAGTAFVDFIRYVATGSQPVPQLPGRFAPELRYAVFVVRPDRVERVELGAAAPIDTALRGWRAAIARDRTERVPDAAPGGRFGTDLRRLVWTPLAARLPKDTAVVYLAPDGDLAQLPWGALPGSANGRILLEEHAVAVVPHGHYLLERLAAAPTPDAFRGRLLAVGDVDYGPAQPGCHVWRALPGTAAELDHVAGLAKENGVPVVRQSGHTADRATAVVELPRARVAHLCTHGFFADAGLRRQLDLEAELFVVRPESILWPAERIGHGDRNPLALSGLVLAGANRADNSETLLTAAAVLDLPLENLDLAVLSACDTGLGETVNGEGVFGLQRAFHMAGAKNVVASLWKVDDAATAALMSLFYRYLWERHLSPVEAMRLAQLTLYHRGDLHPGWTALSRDAISQSVPADEVRAPGPDQDAMPVRRWAAFTVSGVGPVTGASPIEFEEPARPNALSSIALWFGIAAASLIAVVIVMAIFGRPRPRAEKILPPA